VVREERRSNAGHTAQRRERSARQGRGSGIKGRGFKIGDEVGVWDRSGLRATTEPKMGLTMLSVESPAEDDTITVAPVGVRDDPVSLELMRALTEGDTEPASA
jgi:hypothetical protein